MHCVRIPQSLLLTLVLLFAVLAFAQTRKPAPKASSASPHKLLALHVSGAPDYTPREILAAAGLQIGQPVEDADFKSAAQHLADTGLFSDIAYNFEFAAEGTKLDFQLTESATLVPAQFDNFVWFSDQELLSQLSARVPLFHGKLPLAGNLADQVSDALQALLIEHNVNGRADYLRSAPQGGDVNAFTYTVSGPSIRVRHVAFQGPQPDELPPLQQAARSMEGTEYRRSSLRAQIKFNLLPVYSSRGYLKADIADPTPTLVASDTAETLVDLTLSVTRGLQYKLSSLQIAGNSALSTDQINATLHLKPGDIADATRLQSDLDAISKLYTTRGYMAATVVPTCELDDAHATAAYTLTVHEGDVFHMGDLDIQGLDKSTTRTLFDLWKLLGGDVYDSSYPQRFLADRAVGSLLGNSVQKVDIRSSLNAREKTVDVTLHFVLRSQ